MNLLKQPSVLFHILNCVYRACVSRVYWIKLGNKFNLRLWFKYNFIFIIFLPKTDAKYFPNNVKYFLRTMRKLCWWWQGRKFQLSLHQYLWKMRLTVLYLGLKVILVCTNSSKRCNSSFTFLEMKIQNTVCGQQKGALLL